MNLFKLFFIASLCLVFLVNCNTPQLDERPNIVWITSEDNSAHYISLFNKNGIEAPNIESMASRGLTFINAFSNSPVCSAARSTLISGCYGPRLASHYHRNIEPVPMPDSLQMFPVYLQEAGYYTTNNSKEDYNIIKTQHVWNESSNTATWKNRKHNQPFFHVQNIHTTHESRLHFTKEEMDTVINKTALHSFSVQPNHPQTALFRYTNAFYRDKIRQMDSEVGEVINELKRDGLLENTIVFYFGDHGGVLPGSKGYIYETGLHVPLVVYIPSRFESLMDQEVGDKIGGFVSFVDFAATVLNLAGIPVPSSMDGEPFLGKHVSLKEVNKRDVTFSYADRFDEKYDMVRALRKGRYKYLRSYQPFNIDGLMNNYRYKQLAYQEWSDLYKSGKLNSQQSFFFESRAPELLFDIQTDPFETKNLATDPEYTKIRDEMRKMLDDQLISMPDLSFYPEHHLIKSAFHNPVEYGLKHKKDIARYVQVANLALGDLDQSTPMLKENLISNDPWERYWALVVCSSFGELAVELVPLIKQISYEDPILINRVRAAEYLGITDYMNPAEVMIDALYQSTNGAESLLVLNSIVLMKTKFDYEFSFQTDRLAHSVLENSEVQRRLEYLNNL